MVYTRPGGFFRSEWTISNIAGKRALHLDDGIFDGMAHMGYPSVS